MAYRCEKKGIHMNLDVLCKKLCEVDATNYDHQLLGQVMGYLGSLDPVTQKSVIKTALNIDWSYKKLLEHVRGLFVILKQDDDQGKYCGLGFGKECISVATWNGWSLPKHAQEVDTTELCYKSDDGTLRCGHLLDFAEVWMDYHEESFMEFAKGIKFDVGMSK